MDYLTDPLAMTAQEMQLWANLLKFKFDQEGTKFTFARRLANENGWTEEYTDRVLLEYKKFLFLGTINSGGGVTPSDAVDQAWHLHLTYTRSYWNDLCTNVLGKQFHHNPTKGGEAENNKYSKFYDSTKTLYELKFGQEQPQDIWPSNKERFSDADFQRVNRKRNWVIPKPYLRKSLIGSLFTVFLSIIALSFVSMTLTDEEQKWIWISLAIIVLIIVICIIISRNKGGSSGCSSGCAIFCSSCSSDSGCSSGCGGCGGD
jgi:hypothetical protein